MHESFTTDFQGRIVRAERKRYVAVSKRKDTQEEHRASLIPVIERQEQELRTELEQVRREADNQIRQAEKLAQYQIQESRLNVAELVEQKRKEGLAELQERAEQVGRSLEQRRVHLRQQAARNVSRAVQRVINVVTAAGDKT